jgi:hypothetical protein
MNRKEAIEYISLLLGGTMVGASALLSSCNNEEKKMTSSEDTAFLDEVADTILPETSTPGAKAAHVGAFMLMMVNDCYDEKDQKIFKDGMKIIRDRSFIQLTSQQRHDLLVEIDKEQKEYTKNKKDTDPAHYFRMMKELTLLGYFSSKPGVTLAKRYMPVPGKYIGCVDYKKGEKAIV